MCFSLSHRLKVRLIKIKKEPNEHRIEMALAIENTVQNFPILLKCYHSIKLQTLRTVLVRSMHDQIHV